MGSSSSIPGLSRSLFWHTAWTMAGYATRAYGEATATDAATDASALVTLDAEGDIVVAFKGSSCPRDFILDAEVWRSQLMWSQNDSPAEVHHGFLADFEGINLQIVSQVRAHLIIRPGAAIYLTGHSLGGAVATLCALEFVRQGLPVAGVYTFGQPRVGNAAFAKIYDAATISPLHGRLRDITFRIVNQNDLVPRLPGWGCGYRHCGTEIFLEPAAYGLWPGWSVNPPLLYKVLCDVLGLYAAYRNREDVLINEHFLDAYIRQIERIANYLWPILPPEPRPNTLT